MMNLFCEPFPDSVRIGNQNLEIVTDFREWIRFHDLISDTDVPDGLKLHFLREWFVHPPDFLTESHINALCDFYHADAIDYHRDEEQKKEKPAPKPPVFDWCIDAKFLISDFRRFYQMDLFSVHYLHWWQFLALFRGLPEESTCQQRIGYRSIQLKDIKDKNEKKRIKKIKNAIALPFEMTDEMMGAAMADALHR